MFDIFGHLRRRGRVVQIAAPSPTPSPTPTPTPSPTPTPTPTPTVNGFRWLDPVSSTATSWDTWLQSRPSPIPASSTQRKPLSRYWYGSDGHELMRLELADRWGYCLDNTGFSSGIGADQATSIVTDAMLVNPSTANGRLTRKAMSEPDRYKIQAPLVQRYPTQEEQPGGYWIASDLSKAAWSPIASPAAVTASIDNATAFIPVFRQAGLKIAVSYHGGETGLHPMGKETPDFADNSAIVSAKGSDSWFDFISKKKAEQTKLFYTRVKELAPETLVYVYYPADGNQYQSTPGWQYSSFDYKYMKDATQYPSSSNYAYEFNGGLVDDGLSRSNTGRWSLTTNTTSSIVEQIEQYGTPLSYNWVCPMGWYLSPVGQPIARNPVRLAHPLTAAGYMKMSCITGSIGFIDGYFSVDCAPQTSDYTPFDPLDPPPWIINSTVISEAHTRFSYLDEFIFSGDLLPGLMKHQVKGGIPRYEFNGYKQILGFDVADPDVRVWIRKKQGSDKWLVLVWAVNGLDREVTVKDVVGMGRHQLTARRQGSLYIIDYSTGSGSVTWMDVPLPNPLHKPKPYLATAGLDYLDLTLFAPRTLDPTAVPLASSFTISGFTVSSVAVSHITRLHDRVRLTVTGLRATSTGTVSYNGLGELRDTEGNIVDAFTTTF